MASSDDSSSPRSLRTRVAGRLAAALRALLGRPNPVPPVPEPPEPQEDRDPVELAIETLRETPIAEIQRRGFHFQARDFYSALNDLAFLEENHDLWHGRPLPRGVDWDLEAQLELVRRVAPYADELRDVPQDMPPGPPRFHWRNDFWSGLDALVHYGLLREFKPSRVVEIGCGWSSLLMAEALSRNEAEGTPSNVEQIEPYARKQLLSALPAHWNLQETILQRASPEPFEALGEGDVCFYDGSHVARPASDVVWFFSEVIPRLAPGVIVHLHDIFWPSDYPDPWIFERGQTWNEQYVLQAFLMYNREFEPLLSNAIALHTYPTEIDELFGSFPTAMNGGSLWMRRRSAEPSDTETAIGAGPEEIGVVEAPPERAPSGLLLRDAPAVTIKRRDPETAGAFLQEFAGKTEAARGPVAEEGINALDWYHTITLPDGTVTRGMFDHRDLLPHYGIPEDLSGRRVLDVATSSGFWAFEFERRGGEVTATDVPRQQWDWPTDGGTAEPGAPAGKAPPRSRNFELAARALGSRVQLRNLSVYDLSPAEGKFDFVHTADLLVHLERPLEALRRIRSVVADDGTFLLADAVDPETLGDAPLTWYVGGWQNVEWWVPSVTTLAQMVHDAGFTDLEVLRLYNLPAWDDERGFWRAIIRARP
jgi:SAM-dependent methyltransferase/predicted O-methyltransferase YrrM